MSATPSSRSTSSPRVELCQVRMDLAERLPRGSVGAQERQLDGRVTLEEPDQLAAREAGGAQHGDTNVRGIAHSG